MVKPLQGEGGMKVPPAGFLKGLREIADDHDLLLMLDEISAMDVYTTVRWNGFPIEVLPEYDREMNRYTFLMVR